MRKKQVKIIKLLSRALCCILGCLFTLPIFGQLGYALQTKMRGADVVIANADMVDLESVLDEKVFVAASVADFELPYRLYVPETYTAEKKYGIVLFLHGESERGCDNVSQIRSAEATQFIGKLVSDSECKDEFIVLVPQCPAGQEWVERDSPNAEYKFEETKQSKVLSMVMELLYATKKGYSVDANRIILTGFSIGGTGVWDLALRYSGTFAAAMPVGGESDVETAIEAANTPIWAFHSQVGNGYGYAATAEMVTALQKLGAGILFTDIGTNGWEQAYKNENAFSWFLAQKRKLMATKGGSGLVKMEGTPISNVVRPNIGLIMDGVIPTGAVGDEKKSTDTWSSAGSDEEHYFGLTFDSESVIGKIVYTEGYHWPDGGWFADGFRVEVLCEDEWKLIGFEMTPEYPHTNDQYGIPSFVPFEITFEAVLCKGIRVIGQAGGSSKFISCSEFEVYTRELNVETDENTPYNVLTDKQIKDKIKGGWAGQMIGVAWGFPTEFRYNGSMIKDENIPAYSSVSINDAFWQDDLYVEIPFIEALEKEGLDVSIDTLGEYFKNTSFQLWHGNDEARKNLLNGVPASLSGSYLYNSCCEDIDWQIESDFIGQITVGDIEEAIRLAYEYGHIIGYADGVYGGVYISAMHAKAFTATNITEIIVSGVRAVPVGSKFRSLLDDVVAWYSQGKTFEECWNLLWEKWGGDDRCVEGQGCNRSYNIDAKINAGYCLMGLLYGNGDMEESMRLAMKGGCDSDCNPSTVGGVLGNYYGYEAIDEKLLFGLDVNKQFSYTSYSLVDVLQSNYNLALEKAQSRGYSVQDGLWTLPARTEIVSAPLEIWEEQPSIRISTTLRKKVLLVNAEVYSSMGIQKIEWDFGDGSIGTGTNTRHTYLNYGTYIILCRVSANDGSTVERTFTVTIENNVAIDGTAIVSQETPQGGGNKNKGCINDGKKGAIGSGDGGFQYDTFIFSDSEHDDWFGIVFEETMLFNRVVFTEGIHFQDGGWFDGGAKVQVRVDGEWQDVELLDNPYPVGNEAAMGASFTSYTFRFAPIQGDAVRVYGKAGGSGYFASCSELEVFLCEEVQPTFSNTAFEFDALAGGAISVEYEAYGWEISAIQVNGVKISSGYSVKDKTITFGARLFGRDTAVVEIEVVFDNGKSEIIVVNVKGIEKDPDNTSEESSGSSEPETPDDASSSLETDLNKDSVSKKGCSSTVTSVQFFILTLGLAGLVLLKKKKGM